jgi:peptidylprolyl isomerase
MTLFRNFYERKGSNLMTFNRTIIGVGLALGLAFGCAAFANAVSAAPAEDVQKQDPQKQDLKNTIYLDTKDGRITILLRPDLAPKHVAQIEALTKKGFYNGLVFHRVIDGFMAQTGDPTGTGTGKSDLPDIPAEFSGEAFKRGTVGMARSQDPDSANSQFFICFADASFLNHKYTVVGQVIGGMDVVDKIKKGAKDDNGAVTAPDKIVKMQIAAGAKK